jgi:hypothetical protein
MVANLQKGDWYHPGWWLITDHLRQERRAEAEAARDALSRLLVALLLGLAMAAAAAAAMIEDAASARERGGRSLCGIERWDVKTLTDSAVRKINLRPRASSVWTLTHLQLRPSLFGPRRPPVETTIYRITVRVLESRTEADQDVHLIVAGLSHPAATMIVEFPAFNCTAGAPPTLRRRMSAARSAFLRACGQPPAALAGTATIIGVGFIDVPHATGAAANGIELHPVLGFVSHSCA